MKTERRALFVSLVLSLSLASFTPMRAIENESKGAPRELNCGTQTAIVETPLRLFEIALYKTDDFKVPCAMVDAAAKDDRTEYMRAVVEDLIRSEKFFTNSRMLVKLAERLLDLGVDPNLRFFHETMSLSDLACIRLLSRDANGIDNSDYKRLMQKLISLNATVYDRLPLPESSVEHKSFSGKHQREALSLVSPQYAQDVVFVDRIKELGLESSVMSEQHWPSAECELAERAKNRPCNLEWLQEQCPAKAGEFWSCEDAYNRVLHSCLAPDPLPEVIANLVEEYHDYVVDAGEPVPYDAERSEDGGQAPEHG
jgi:hypothetical protein